MVCVSAAVLSPNPAAYAASMQPLSACGWKEIEHKAGLRFRQNLAGVEAMGAIYFSPCNAFAASIATQT